TERDFSDIVYSPCQGQLLRRQKREAAWRQQKDWVTQKKTDIVLTRIEAFHTAQDGGVVIQQAAKGYSLFRADTGKPLARLRPTGKGDQDVTIPPSEGYNFPAREPRRAM